MLLALKATLLIEELYALTEEDCPGDYGGHNKPNHHALNDNIGVLNGKLFSSMRHGAVFINTGRGAQVNEAELIEVLEKRPDLTALLDVTHPEPPAEGSKLYPLPNVQQSSHIAGSVNDEVHRMADYMLDEFRRYIAGEPLKYQVVESMLLTSTK